VLLAAWRGGGAESGGLGGLRGRGVSNRALDGSGGEIFGREKFKIFGEKFSCYIRELGCRSRPSRSKVVKFDKSFYLAWFLLMQSSCRTVKADRPQPAEPKARS
jgi:hypothetical protein